MDTDLTDDPGTGTPANATRRLVLGAGLTGAALTLLPIAARRAGAQSDTTIPRTTTPGTSTPATTTATTTTATTTATTTPATTTTAPPKRPTDADIPMLAFAETLELAAVELYEAALATGGLAEPIRLVLVTITEAHRAYANNLSAFLGRSANGTTNSALISKYRGRFSSASTRMAAAIEIESSFVATYRGMIGTLQGTDGAALIAAILVAEARHGTVLADASGATDLPSLLDDKPAAAIPVGA